MKRKMVEKDGKFYEKKVLEGSDIFGIVTVILVIGYLGYHVVRYLKGF